MAAVAGVAAESQSSSQVEEEKSKKTEVEEEKERERDMQGLTLPLAATVLGASAWAVREDLLTHRVPNALTGPVLALGLLFQLAQSGWIGLGDALLGALVGLAMLMPFYLLRAMGAGDVKLLTALGAALGPYWALVAGVDTLIAGGVFAVGYLLYGAAQAALRPVGVPWIVRLHCARARAHELRRARFPYAIAIATGSVAALVRRGDLQIIYDSLTGVRT
jgi:prepilin peptidase CpaA